MQECRPHRPQEHLPSRKWFRDVVLPHDVIRRPRRRGFTLIEVLIIIAMIGTLTAIGIPVYANALDRAKVTKAIADIHAFDREIRVYHLFNGKPPATLAAIGRANWRDPYGNPYEYLNISCDETTGKCKAPKNHRKDKFFKPLNWDFDLYSKGKDGLTKDKIDTKEGADDIIRAVNGGFVGLASEF